VSDVIKLRLPSRLELLSVLDRVADSVCERLEFDDDARSQVTMSVIEAGTNAIQHGHHRDPSLPVDVEFAMRSDELEITVRDRGTGFDPQAVNGDITSPEHLLDARGRGLFIMRCCMDSVEFTFGKDGTVCRLVKKRRPKAENA
jgi:serine/threonine-protein kinase RsbW